MKELEYLIKRKKLKEDYYIRFKQRFLQTNDLKQTIEKPFKRVCLSSVRANFYLEFLEYCISKLKQDKDIYESLSFQQKKEIKFFYDSLHQIHYNSTINLEYISEIV